MMGRATEVIKIVCLASIVGLLAYQAIPSRPKTELPSPQVSSPQKMTDAIPSLKDKDAREAALKVAEHRLRGIFKFPDSVKVKYNKLDVHDVYREAGLTSIKLTNEVQTLQACGLYSAPTPMGLYGALEPFYVRVVADHDDKMLGGEVFFSNDGKWQKISSLDWGFSLPSKETDLEEAGYAFCKDEQGVDKGRFEAYRLGVSLANFYKRDSDRIRDDKSYFDFMNSCVSANKLSDCGNVYACVKDPKRNGECEKLTGCTADEPFSACLAKMKQYEVDQRAKREAERAKGK